MTNSLRWIRDRSQPGVLLTGLVLGPSVLVFASLNDIFLVTRVFKTDDPLVGLLAFFIFGAATGVPIQLILAGSVVASKSMKRSDGNSSAQAYDRRGAALTGILSAVSTAAWLFAVGQTDPAVVLPLANLSPALFALAEVVRGSLRLVQVFTPVALLSIGLMIVKAPGPSHTLGLTSLVVFALVVRNLAYVGAEVAERSGILGAASKFSAARFTWLAGMGIPAALAVAVFTGRMEACIALILHAWKVALPVHALTMLLTFVGGVCRIKAKAKYPLTICSAVYATPLVLTPVLAVGVNLAFEGLFPTVTGSIRLLVGALLVVSSACWLTVSCGGNAPPVTECGLNTQQLQPK